MLLVTVMPHLAQGLSNDYRYRDMKGRSLNYTE